MSMQHTPLVMSRLVDRGAAVAPDVEVVTAGESGPRRPGRRVATSRAAYVAWPWNQVLAGGSVRVTAESIEYRAARRKSPARVAKTTKKACPSIELTLPMFFKSNGCRRIYLGTSLENR